MRQFAWYSPELDVIVLQSFMQDCYINFEWGLENMDVYYSGATEQTLWMPLGEI